MDSTEKLNIKSQNALDIILKQAMYAEDISETLTGKDYGKRPLLSANYR